MNHVDVTAIVPVLNMDEYLDEFLDSFSSQTFFNRSELVLDLNLPSPYALNTVEKYLSRYGKRLRVLTHENIDPIAVSMNNAIREASGRYIAIWNADDLRSPNSLELQFQAMTSEKDVVGVSGPYEVVSVFGSNAGRKIDDSSVSADDLLRGMHLGPFFMFDSEVLSKIGYFDEQLKSGADFDFAIRLARAGKVIFVDQILGYYLDAGKGASTRPNSLQAIERSVIELRYGIFDKFEPQYLPDTLRYDLSNLVFFGDRHPTNEVFQGYWDHIEKNSTIYKVKLQQSRLSRIAGVLGKNYRKLPAL
jgi:glycosyltransferase involved in cell wall biosynthesis